MLLQEDSSASVPDEISNSKLKALITEANEKVVDDNTNETDGDDGGDKFDEVCHLLSSPYST